MVWTDYGPVVVPSRRERALLGALALRGGQAVDQDTLTDAIFGDQPPARPRHALATLVLRVRERFGPTVVQTADGGYRLGREVETSGASRRRSPGCVSRSSGRVPCGTDGRHGGDARRHVGRGDRQSLGVRAAALRSASFSPSRRSRVAGRVRSSLEAADHGRQPPGMSRTVRSPRRAGEAADPPDLLGGEDSAALGRPH